MFCEKHKVSVAAPFMRIFLVGFSCFPRGNLQFSGCADLTNRKKGLRIAVISKPMIGNSTRCKTAKRAPFGETGCGLRGEWLHEGGRENRPTFGRVRSQAVTTAVKRAFMRQFGWYRRNLTSCPLEFGTRGFTFWGASEKSKTCLFHKYGRVSALKILGSRKASCGFRLEPASSLRNILRFLCFQIHP